MYLVSLQRQGRKASCTSDGVVVSDWYNHMVTEAQQALPAR